MTPIAVNSRSVNVDFGFNSRPEGRMNIAGLLPHLHQLDGILRGLDLWAGLGEATEPITSIHISERGRFGASRILAEEEEVCWGNTPCC